MKSENKICLLLALLYSFPFLFFGLLLLFFSLPVHAAESSSVQTFYVDQYSNLPSEKYSELNFNFSTSSSGIVGISNHVSGDYYSFSIKEYNQKDDALYSLSSQTCNWHAKMTYFKYPNLNYEDDNVNNHFFTSFNYGSYNTDNGLMTISYKTNIPVFDTYAHALSYVKTGDKTGILNGGSIDNPDFEDAAYAFTGFTANSKMTATWTGTTERSYLKDEDVEEYVRVSYGFAAKDAPDSIKQVDNDSKEYSTAAKSLTVKVSDLVPDDDSWFLRYVQVMPCYRQAGLGVWGDFYHGVACKVYFNQDGSIDKIVRDFPQGSGDYSYKHIFSSDKYSNEIPAPELSAISHNGFTLLNNSNNDYYVDIILESNLYGVKMEKNAGTWLPVVDTDWIYNSHYYNFADTSQIAINNDVIYIPNLFSVNPESDLVDDFKKWSSEYSSYSSLPSMSFLKRSTAARTRYVDQFLFKDTSKYSDSEQLRFSHMAESVFYVRYYNKSMVYGPWVRYKFRDGYVAQVIDGTLGGAYIDVGQVDTDDSGNVRVDENGNPIVSDNVSGRQDYDTGESDFSDGSFSLDLSDVTKFFDYLKKIFESVTGALSSFGSVVAACFGFLPGELINALIFGICVMMFIGIIKAVKG